MLGSGASLDCRPASGLGARYASLLASGLAIAAIATLCTPLAHHGCTRGPLGELRDPQPGTARASYCSAVDGGASWLLTAMLPTAAFVGLGFVARDRPRIWIPIGMTIGALVIAHALLATQLNANPTI